MPSYFERLPRVAYGAAAVEGIHRVHLVGDHSVDYIHLVYRLVCGKSTVLSPVWM